MGCLLKPALPPLDQEEATLKSFHAEALRRSAGPPAAGWQRSQIAALIGAASGWVGPAGLFDSRMRLTMVLTPPGRPDFDRNAIPIPERWAVAFQWEYARQQDDMPPALLYLAVRAARRALAVNPDDAQAYEVLGESYLRLMRGTRERAGEIACPNSSNSAAPASAALNRAILLKPGFAKAQLI